MKTLPERKTPVHMPIMDYIDRSVIVFLTLCTEKRKSILAHSDVHTLLLNAWERADAWKVGHYIIMPDHIHLFCSPSRTDSPEIKRWIQYWKTISSKRWPRPYEQPVWQKSFWDTRLRLGESYSSKWEYIRENPIRAGLCALPEDWPFQGEMEVLPWYD
ncbi:MAG: transposase [Deltaproteobacteria bacterium]|nr:transposase [Deltaproteobacteria bacterium]